MIEFNMLSGHVVLILFISLKSVFSTSNELQTCDSYMNDMTVIGQASNTTVWSYCDYPNPRKAWSQCGQESQSWVCDPGRVISKEQAYTLNQFLMESFDKTQCRCGDACPEFDDVTPTAHTGHPLAIVILQDMFITDYQEPETINCSVTQGCVMNFPLVNYTVREPTDKDVKVALQEFGEYLRQKWKYALCDDDVIVIYLHKYKKLYVVGGAKAMEILDEETIKSGQELAEEYFRKGKTYDGINKAMEKYSERLRWKINFPLIIGISCVCILAILIIFAVLFNVLYCKKGREEGKSYGTIMSELNPMYT